MFGFQVVQVKPEGLLGVADERFRRWGCAREWLVYRNPIDALVKPGHQSAEPEEQAGFEGNADPLIEGDKELGQHVIRPQSNRNRVPGIGEGFATL